MVVSIWPAPSEIVGTASFNSWANLTSNAVREIPTYRPDNYPHVPVMWATPPVWGCVL